MKSTNEKILATLGMVGIIKPCCLLLWASVFFGSSSTTLGTISGYFVWMMPYEKYFIIFTLLTLLIGQIEIWKGLVRRLRNPIKTPWKNWVVKNVAIQLVTITSIIIFFFPWILPWNMNH
jgi:hypothetical protein